MNLLVLVMQDFQDLEIVGVTSIFKKSNMFNNITFYSPQNLNKVCGQFQIATIECETKIDLSQYDAIYVPGGKGATILRSNNIGIQTIKHFFDFNKWVLAICDAPNAIDESNLLKDDYQYISWANCLSNNQKRIKDQNTNLFWSHKFITGRSSVQTIQFALYCLHIIFKNAGFNWKEFLKDLSGRF